MVRKNPLGQSSAFDMSDDDNSPNPHGLTNADFNTHLSTANFKPSGGELQKARERIAELEQQISQQGGALTLGDGDVIDVGMFRLTPTGMLFYEGATEDDFKTIGGILFRIQNSIQWLIGDWLNAAAVYEFAEIALIAAQYGRSPKTLQNWKYTASSVPYEARRVELEYNHHVVVQGLSVDEQKRLLGLAVYGDEIPKSNGKRRRWSVARLHREMSGVALPRPKSNKVVREKQRQFKQLFASIKAGIPPKTDDIRALKKWLSELENAQKND